MLGAGLADEYQMHFNSAMSVPIQQQSSAVLGVGPTVSSWVSRAAALSTIICWLQSKVPPRQYPRLTSAQVTPGTLHHPAAEINVARGAHVIM